MAGCIFSVFIWMSFLLLLSYSRKKEIFDWIVAMQTDVSIETVGQDTEESWNDVYDHPKTAKKNGISSVFLFSIYFMGINLIIFHDCCHCLISTLVSHKMLYSIFFRTSTWIYTNKSLSRCPCRLIPIMYRYILREYHVVQLSHPVRPLSCTYTVRWQRIHLYRLLPGISYSTGACSLATAIRKKDIERHTVNIFWEKYTSQ